MLGTVCAVDQAVVAWGEIVALSHVVIVGRVRDGHLCLLKLLAHFRGPLHTVSHVIHKK
jgi:hypothetical protein